MKVRELIQILEECDPELEVLIQMNGYNASLNWTSKGVSQILLGARSFIRRKD